MGNRIEIGISRHKSILRGHTEPVGLVRFGDVRFRASGVELRV